MTATAASEISSSDDELKFQAFLDEVEQLSIHHHNDQEASSSANANDENNNDANAAGRIKVNANNAKDNGNHESHNGSNPSSVTTVTANEDKPTHAKNKKGNKSGKQKNKIMIANANGNQKAWSEFKKLDLSSTNPSNDNGNGSGSGSNNENENNKAKPKMSFQIKNGKDKNKKKKKKTTASNANKTAIKQVGAAPCSGTETTTAISPSGNMDGSIIDNDLICPRWTLVIDTCCLIHDNGTEVHHLIDLAHHIASHLRRAHQHHENMALRTTTVEEPVDIVIPFKVWSELEYRSKSTESNVAYAARAVMRMLRDELEQGSLSMPSVVLGNNGIYDVLRSQSLLESHEAAETYLPKDSPSTNDDHILACALMEHGKFQRQQQQQQRQRQRQSSNSFLAGGVVVVTVDNNLACKAIANGLKVYTPEKFQRYYHTRMASLRQRASDSLANSALRR